MTLEEPLLEYCGSGYSEKEDAHGNSSDVMEKVRGCVANSRGEGPETEEYLLH